MGVAALKLRNRTDVQAIFILFDKYFKLKYFCSLFHIIELYHEGGNVILKSMSEMGETAPQGVAPEQEMPQQKRLEDMPEFQALAPEQQEKVLAWQESLMKEVGEPVAEIATGTEQMSFLAEMGKHWKDTLVKRLGLTWKDVKAVGIGVVAALPLVDKAYAGVNILQKGKAFKEGYKAVKTGNFAAKGQALSQAEFIIKDGKLALEASKGGFFNAVGAGLRNVGEVNRVHHAAQAAEFAQKNIATATRQAAAAEQQAYLHAAHQLGVDKGLTGKIATSFGAKRIEKDVWRATKSGMTKMELLQKTGSLNASKLEKLKAGVRVEGKLAGEVFKDNLRSKIFREVLQHPQAPGLLVAGINMAEELGLDQKKKVRNAVGKTLDFINPTPDVPELLSLASFGADLLVPGAGVIPSIWQYVDNRFKAGELYFQSVKKSIEITKKHWDKKFNRLKEPDVAQSADVFTKSSAPAVL